MTLSLSKADDLAREVYAQNFVRMATSGLPFHLIAVADGVLLTSYPLQNDILVSDVHTMSERQMAQALRRKLKHHTPKVWK